MLKRVSSLLILIASFIMFVGAIYIALVHHSYAISSCFVVAGVLLLFGNSSSKKDR